MQHDSGEATCGLAELRYHTLVCDGIDIFKWLAITNCSWRPKHALFIRIVVQWAEVHFQIQF